VKEHLPNLDMLSAYVDGVLSPDAKRSMEQHLERCEICAAAMAKEQAFLASLDHLAEVAPPADFVNAVMGRVAQQPTFRPATPIPWRAAVRWSVAASLVLTVLAATGVAWMLGSGALGDADPTSLVGSGIAGLVSFLASGVATAREWARPALALLENAGKVLWRLTAMTLNSGWVVQISLLLLTVSLNYAFTRLVLGYQRRN